LYAITASLATRLLCNLVAAFGEVLGGAKDIPDGVDAEIRRAGIETDRRPVAGHFQASGPSQRPASTGFRVM